jgi:hypothetical protein
MYNEQVPDISEELAKTQVTSIIEEFDCNTPRRYITIEYSGPGIRKIVKSMPGVLKNGLRTSGTNVFLDQYYVTVLDPNITYFHIFWHGEKGFDSRTRMETHIKLKHGKVKSDGTGSVIIEFYSKLTTEWDKKTLVQRSPIYALFVKLYNYIFYDARRRALIESCKFFQEEIIRKTKELLKLVETRPYPS